MATTRPFAYNPTSATITGTTNIGTLCIGVSALDYSSKPGGLTWWMGPDESIGYVITTVQTTSDFPTPLGNIGSVKFWRTNSFTDNEFKSLAQYVTGQVFTDTAAAVTWLNSNNYYTSYTSSAFDTDAQTFITNAGITDSTEKIAVNNLVVDLKGYGIWTKFKVIYPFVGGSAATHKFNLKNPLDTNESFRLTFSGGWIHSSTGAKPNGTNGYAETYFNISSGFTNANKGSAGGYWRTITTNNGYFFGINTPVSTINSRFWIRPISGTGMDHYAGGTTLLRDSSVTDYSGFRAMSRIASNDMFAVKKDGSFITLTTNVTIPFSNETLILAAVKVVGTISGYSSAEISFGYMSDDITQSEMTNLRTAVNSFQTTLGRNV